MSRPDRRLFLKTSLASAVALTAFPSVLSGEDVKSVEDMKPGEFAWHPERAAEGPVAIIVSIPDQRVHVYRNGIRIGVATCSTGRKGHSTPTGVFTILEKDKHHRSSTYNNAPMPNMNRLTWSGIALHAGNLPGYPASHGCIRLPIKFSELLFGVTHVGTPVIIAGNHKSPTEVIHPGLVLSEYAEHEFESLEAKLSKKKQPWAATITQFESPLSVVISKADSSVTVFQNGHIVLDGRATFRDPNRPLGSHVFILTGTNNDQRGMHWHAIGHHHDEDTDVFSADADVLKRIKTSRDVTATIHDRMHPGTVLVTTDLPAHPDTRSGRDFVVMTHG